MSFQVTAAAGQCPGSGKRKSGFLAAAKGAHSSRSLSWSLPSVTYLIRAPAKDELMLVQHGGADIRPERAREHLPSRSTQWPLLVCYKTGGGSAKSKRTQGADAASGYLQQASYSQQHRARRACRPAGAALSRWSSERLMALHAQLAFMALPKRGPALASHVTFLVTCSFSSPRRESMR